MSVLERAAGGSLPKEHHPMSGAHASFLDSLALHLPAWREGRKEKDSGIVERGDGWKVREVARHTKGKRIGNEKREEHFNEKKNRKR